MVRRNIDRRELVEVAAWREYGKRNYAWIVGWAIVRRLAPFVLFFVPAGLLVWWIVRTIGGIGAAGLPSAPVSAGPWPWVLLALSAATGVFLCVYRWANPCRGGVRLAVGIVLCFALSALAVLWARSTS